MSWALALAWAVGSMWDEQRLNAFPKTAAINCESASPKGEERKMRLKEKDGRGQERGEEREERRGEDR